MCLVLFAYRYHPEYELVLLANRDEFYERPTEPARFWEDESGLLAGRDLKAGGTWMGVTRTGRYAAVTNYRDLRNHDPDAPSRGALVTQFLRSGDPPEAHLLRLALQAHRYNGYNLIAGDLDHLCYFSNREGTVRRLEPGLYGLSNHLLDTSWFKVEEGKAALRRALTAGHPDPDTLLAILEDRTEAAPERLPDTGVGPEWERVLSPIYISSPTYGTRSSTVLLIDRNANVTFIERSLNAPDGEPETQTFQFHAEPAPAKAEP